MVRYIDADNAISRLQARCVNCRDYDCCTNCYVDKIIDEFRKAPTADVAPKADVARAIFEELNQANLIRLTEDYWKIYKKYTEGEE